MDSYRQRLFADKLFEEKIRAYFEAHSLELPKGQNFGNLGKFPEGMRYKEFINGLFSRIRAGLEKTVPADKLSTDIPTLDRKDTWGQAKLRISLPGDDKERNIEFIIVITSQTVDSDYLQVRDVQIDSFDYKEPEKIARLIADIYSNYMTDWDECRKRAAKTARLMEMTRASLEPALHAKLPGKNLPWNLEERNGLLLLLIRFPNTLGAQLKIDPAAFDGSTDSIFEAIDMIQAMMDVETDGIYIDLPPHYTFGSGDLGIKISPEAFFGDMDAMHRTIDLVHAALTVKLPGCDGKSPAWDIIDLEDRYADRIVWEH